jgi:prepilin peptidase CpaA
VNPLISNQTIVFLSTALVFAAINDLQFRKIPNLLNFLVIGLSVIFYSWVYGFEGLIFSVSGMLLGIALLIGPYLLGGMGAGDAKLMGAVGAVLGPKGVFICFFYVAMVGGIYAGIMLLVYRSHGRVIISNVLTGIKSLLITRQWVPTVPEPHEKSPRLCYGLAIALGTFIYLALERMGYNLFQGFRF